MVVQHNDHIKVVREMYFFRRKISFYFVYYSIGDYHRSVVDICSDYLAASTLKVELFQIWFLIEESELDSSARTREPKYQK